MQLSRTDSVQIAHDKTERDLRDVSSPEREGLSRLPAPYFQLTLIEVSGPVEAFFNALGKYSWRTLFGIFVAAGAILFMPNILGVADWWLHYHSYLVAAFIISGAVLFTHLVTTVYARVIEGGGKKIDLRIVAPSSSLHSTWSVTVTPLDKKPMMILICELSFAHFENGSVILKRGYMKGTTEAFPMVDLVVEGAYDERASICISVTPVKAKPGKELKARLVFVDQFNGKHVSDKITFRPNTMPDDFIKTKILNACPNCVFCGQPVTFGDQTKEAQMTAHTRCVWR